MDRSVQRCRSLMITLTGPSDDSPRCSSRAAWLKPGGVRCTPILFRTKPAYPYCLPMGMNDVGGEASCKGRQASIGKRWASCARVVPKGLGGDPPKPPGDRRQTPRGTAANSPGDRRQTPRGTVAKPPGGPSPNPPGDRRQTPRGTVAKPPEGPSPNPPGDRRQTPRGDRRQTPRGTVPVPNFRRGPSSTARWTALPPAGGQP